MFYLSHPAVFAGVPSLNELVDRMFSLDDFSQFLPLEFLVVFHHLLTSLIHCFLSLSYLLNF